MIRAGRFFIVLTLLAGCCLPAAAATVGGSAGKHMFRLGWGDMLFETAAYSPTIPHVFENPAAVPDWYCSKENFSNWYTGHIFAEYQYSLADFFSVGGQIDFEGLGWKSAWFDKYHNIVETAPDVNIFNFIIMPTVRVTYLRKEMVSVYSGIGAGLLLSVAQSVEPAPAAYVNLVGVRIGSGNWSGSLDLGAMASMNGFTKVYLFGSRILSVSLNYSW